MAGSQACKAKRLDPRAQFLAPFLELLKKCLAVNALARFKIRKAARNLLAMEQRAAFLLLDERDGVAAASALDLRVVGTLGVLDAAAAREWIDLPAMFGRLRQTTFRSPHRLMATMLAHDAQRKTQQTKE